MATDPLSSSRRGPGPWLPWALTAAVWLVAALSGVLAPKEAPAAVETPPPARAVLEGLLTTGGAAEFTAMLKGPAGTRDPASPPTEATPLPPKPQPEVAALTATPEPDVADKAAPETPPEGGEPSREIISPTHESPPARALEPVPARPQPARLQPATPQPAAPAPGPSRVAEVPKAAPTPATESASEPAPTKTLSLSEAMGAANAHLNASRWADAETSFTAALTLPGGRSAAVLFGRARARDGLGRTADALSDLEAALALDPRHPYALLLAGDIARRTRDTATAAVRYRAYLEAWPKGRRAAEIERWLKAHGG